MTYLEKWFDFNRRQKEIESLLEETVANQSEQSLTLKEFYLLYYLDLAQEKSLRQIDLPDKLHLSPSPVSSDEIGMVVNRIEQKLRSRSENEIQSEYIGSLVMEELAELDEITYVRFASVYRSFKDVSELESLLQQITQSSKKKKEK